MKMKKNRVFVSAYSAVSALGLGVDETLANLQKGKQLFTSDRDSDFAYPCFAVNRFEKSDDLTKSSSICLFLLKDIEESFSRYNDIPLFMATSTGGIRETEEVYNRLVDKTISYPLFKRHFFNKTINDIKGRYTNFNDSFTFSTACSSSGHSVFQAYRMIQAGLIERAVLIGYDTLSYTTMIGFDSLKLISHTGTKPLTKSRDGLTLGDGGGVIFLEAEPKDEPLAEIIGVASNSDGHHISSPEPDGFSQKKCINDALKQAGLTPGDIKYICAHGTGTLMNDEVEINALDVVFKGDVTVTSLKSFIGHTLGASAIAESVISTAMLKKGRVYQPENFTESMNERIIPSASVDMKTRYFLKNSFGFGGNNVSALFEVF